MLRLLLLFFIFLFHVVDASKSSGDEIVAAMAERFQRNAEDVEFYQNGLARDIVHKDYGSEYAVSSVECNTKNLPCMRPKTKIPKGSYILALDTSLFSLTADEVLSEYPELRSLLNQRALDEYMSPTLLFSLYLWFDVGDSGSFFLTFIQSVSKRSFKECGTVLSTTVCTPHLWNQKNLLFPSFLHQLIEEELKYLQNMYKDLEKHVFPYMKEFVETQSHSEQMWIEIFLTARGFTFVRPYDQEQVFFPGFAAFPHNSESKVIVGWTEKVFYLQAEKDYFLGEISINYWDVLGSLSSFIEEPELETKGMNYEEYKLQKAATLNTQQILLHFGQLPLNNRNHTHLILQIKLSFDDVIVKELLRTWVQKISFVKNEIAEFRLQPDTFPSAFMSIARLVSLKMEDMEPNIKEIIAGDKIVNFENEFLAMRKVYRLLQQYIDSYYYPEEYIEEIWQVHHTNLDRETISRLRLHYFELQVLRSAQESILQRWYTILDKGDIGIIT